MRNNLFSIIPYLQDIRKEVIHYNPNQLINDQEFLKLLGYKITKKDLLRFEDNDIIRKKSINEQRIEEYCNAFLIFIGIDDGIDTQLFNREEHPTIMSEIKKVWEIKQRPIAENNFELKHNEYLIKMNDLEKRIDVINELSFQLFSKNDKIFIESLDLISRNLQMLNQEKYSPTQCLDSIFHLYRELIRHCNHSANHSEKLFKHILESIQELLMKRMELSNTNYRNTLEIGIKKLLLLYSEFKNMDFSENRIYLGWQDLSFIDLSVSETKEHNYLLKAAWFNSSNIESTNFSNWDLSYSNFNGIKSSKNACFQNTLLCGATFVRANLTGVNKSSKGYINNMSKEEAGAPFLDVASFKGVTEIDKWLKDYLIANNKGHLFN
jgi:uncharacterized protein YjbI with pentapeptide repeats